MSFLLDIPSITPEYVTTLPFVTLEQRTQIPDLAGVYAIYAYSINSNKPKILYVGKSENIAQRLKNHEIVSQLSLLQCIEITVCVAYLALEMPFDDIGIIETVFINELLPHFNVHHKGLSDAASYQTARVKHEIQTQLEDAKDWSDDNTSSKNIRALKKEASQLGVNLYSYMNKAQLVASINRAKANHNDVSHFNTI